jgi:uncharacterized protein
MSRNLLALAAGLVFGLGLCLSGMYDPQKVQGFLDLAGAWDPSLAFVMGGAIAVALPAFWLARRRAHAWSGDPIELPGAHRIDLALVVGAAIFGAGWGIAGACPGPGLLDLGFFSRDALIFVMAMTAGMFAQRALGLRLRESRPIAQDA